VRRPAFSLLPNSLLPAITRLRTEPHSDIGAKALVFVHVPKTAGTTLSWIIQRQYPADRTIIIQPEEMLRKYRDFQTLSEDARRRLLCIAGHIPFGVHRWLPQGARYITMLRDPVEWTLSFHSFVQRMPFFDEDPDLAAFRDVRSLNIDGFVDFLIRSNMADLQTRHISGQMDLRNLLPPHEPMTSDSLDCAKRKLRADFECVGVVERFDESLLLMKRKLGWRNIYYQRLNVSKARAGRAELPQATLNSILECNRRDVELYDEACRLLSAEILKAGNGFQTELRRFQRNSVIYNRLMPIYEASGLSRVRYALRRGLEALR